MNTTHTGVRYTDAEKKNAIRIVDQYRTKGMTLAEAIEKAGVSYSSLYKWRFAFRAPKRASGTTVRAKNKTATIRRVRKAA